MFAKYLTYTKHNFNIYDGLSHLIFTSGQVPFFERFHFMVKETDTHLCLFLHCSKVEVVGFESYSCLGGNGLGGAYHPRGGRQ